MDLLKIAHAIKQGKIIAYPTEAVYGLGCDPLNKTAVKQIASLKKRSLAKGFIIIAKMYSQIKPFIKELSKTQMEKVRSTWPGPVTWVFPKSEIAPPWITGEYETIAVRLTDHPIAKALCEHCGPLLSTSANIEGQRPAKTPSEVRTYFPHHIDIIIEGDLGTCTKPSEIRDAQSGRVIRAG